MGSCRMVLSRRLVSRAFSFSFLKLKKKINSIRAKVTFGFRSGDSGNFLDLFGRLFKSIDSLWFREQIPRRQPSSGGFLRKVTCSFIQRIPAEHLVWAGPWARCQEIHYQLKPRIIPGAFKASGKHLLWFPWMSFLQILGPTVYGYALIWVEKMKSVASCHISYEQMSPSIIVTGNPEPFIPTNINWAPKYMPNTVPDSEDEN